MNSSLLFLEQIASISDARHDPGEYWQSIMKDEAMPEAIQGLIDTRESVSPRSNKKTECHTSAKEKHFVEDFEPRPNISAYHDDEKPEENKDFVKDFEPRPNISAYHNDEKLEENKDFVTDFEPRPDATIYHDLEVARIS